MDIATIQKRKFLYNIYKLFYSEGPQRYHTQDVNFNSNDTEIVKLFSNYFSVNKLGRPIDINYSLLQSINTTDVDVLNDLMASSLLNLEVLYDCLGENNNEMFKIITTLNGKLENLKAKRKFLEGKIDDLLFANSNVDGFFYSYLENFSDTQKIDLNFTNSYIDTSNGVVKIPKITSSISNALAVENILSSSATYSILSNNRTIINKTNIDNIDVLFDGLTDTYWSYDFLTDNLAVITCEIEIPISSSFNISKIEGSLMTSSPCAIQISALPSDATRPIEVRSKNSKNDYNNFSFAIPSGNYSKIIMILYKTEPDSILSNNSNSYSYNFGIRELIIGSDYHDIRSTLVSKPIKIDATDNKNLSINAVSIDVQDQVDPGTGIAYYVAADVPNAVSINDFNWQSISPWSSSTDGFEKVVNLSNNNFNIKYISSQLNDLTPIALNTTSSNLNELNPAILPYTNKSIYRVCKVDPNANYIDPYILSNLNCFKFYNKDISGNINVSLYKSLDNWREEINSINNPSLDKNIIFNQIGSIDIPLQYPSIGLLESKIMSEKEHNVTHTITKSSSDFNLAVYLNGGNIVDLPTGTISKTIEWNIIQGINNIIITYDKSSSGSIFFNLMSGKNITDYGNLFLEYYRYLDPIEFRRAANEYVNVFTIDDFYGSKQILASNSFYNNETSSDSENVNKSVIRYYSNPESVVDAIRYRVDFSRYSNPLQTPILDAIRIKFKHNNN